MRPFTSPGCVRDEALDVHVAFETSAATARRRGGSAQYDAENVSARRRRRLKLTLRGLCSGCVNSV